MEIYKTRKFDLFNKSFCLWEGAMKLGARECVDKDNNHVQRACPIFGLRLLLD